MSLALIILLVFPFKNSHNSCFDETTQLVSPINFFQSFLCKLESLLLAFGGRDPSVLSNTDKKRLKASNAGPCCPY